MTIVQPAAEYGALAPVVEWLPSGALGEAMRSALVDASLDASALLVLAAWAAVGGVLAGRYFSWE